MSLNMNQKRRLLESIEYIDDAMISDTMSRVRTDAVTVGMPSKGKRHIIWIKQVSVLAACALLLGAIIPVISFVSKNTNPFGGFGAGANPGVEETDPKPEVTEALETDPPETEPEETEFVPDEHGTPGLLYEINEDGKSASFIGWGDCTDEKVYVASVYEGLPVTQMVYVEREVANFNDQKSGEDNVSVKHIIISDTVEYVESEALNMCTNLESVHFGASVSEIKGSIYYNNDRGRNFNRITVSPENKFYTEKGNCLIRIKDKVLLCGFANSTIPDDGSVEIIGTVAFFNKPGLTKVVVPEGVIRIMGTAFGENDELVSVSLPSTIKTIFVSFCDLPILTEFKYAGTVKQWNALMKTCDGWIRDTSLTQVTCSDGVVELKFDSHGELIDMVNMVDLSLIAIENIDLSASTEVGVELAYESDDFIIFYGSIGLFGYDLNKKEIIFAVDLMKAVGIEGSIQGSRGTSVEVSTDGKKIIISDYDVERNVRHKTCYIDVPTLTYTISDYKPLDKTFERDSAKGYIYPGVKVGQVKYIIDSKEWIIFDK